MRYHSYRLFIVSGVVGVAALASLSLIVHAASSQDIVFPIAELGNCKSEADCRTYCEQRDSADVIRACLSFAGEHNLLPRDVVAQGKKFADVAAGGGPGGCKDEKSCVAYCENTTHIQECTSFVEQYKLVPPDRLAEMKKFAAAIKAGAKPPGNCTNKESCITYCEDSTHIDECLAFAEKAGFISPDELALAKKVAPFLKSGDTPGACKSKAQCEAYCSDTSHFEPCLDFAQKLGVMSAREAELLKKVQGRSPGDCAKGSPEQAGARCAAFCNEPTNAPTCMKFAAEMGIMTAEEASQAGSLQDFQACYAISTPKIKSCLEEKLGSDLLSNLLKGIMPADLEDVEKMMGKIRNARDCTNRYADQQLQTFTDNPDALACVDSEMGTGFFDQLKSGQVSCGDASVFQKKVASCMEAALGKKLDQCFALACSDMKTCIQKFQDQSKEPIGEENISFDPSWKDKMSEKMNTCMAEDVRSCLAKDCSALMPCLNKLQEGGEKQQEGENKLDPALQAEMNAKISACTPKQESGSSGQQQGPSQTSQAPEGQQQPSQEGQIPQDQCSSFASVPSCSYVGDTDSQNYKYCKQCYPDK
ncbi:MAG: hypothetical protein Q7S95_02210 [bacterium]|nr:hypothetical protein [bacterium]